MLSWMARLLRDRTIEDIESFQDKTTETKYLYRMEFMFNWFSEHEKEKGFGDVIGRGLISDGRLIKVEMLNYHRDNYLHILAALPDAYYSPDQIIWVDEIRTDGIWEE